MKSTSQPTGGPWEYADFSGKAKQGLNALLNIKELMFNWVVQVLCGDGDSKGSDAKHLKRWVPGPAPTSHVPYSRSLGCLLYTSDAADDPRVV